MGVTRTEIFTTDLLRKAELLKALGHPARLRITQLLLERQTCICGSLVDELGLAQATISQHLKALKEVGIIKGTVEGTSVCYCLEPNTWNEILDLFAGFNHAFDIETTCC